MERYELNSGLAERFGVQGRWRFAMQRDCEWADMDALYHVNNVKYVEWCQEARIRYYRTVTGGWPGTAQLDFVVRHVEFTFERPLVIGDQVLVTARTAGFGTTSFVQEYAVWKTGLVGTGKAVCVTIDTTLNAKTPVPERLRDAVRNYEQEHLERK